MQNVGVDPGVTQRASRGWAPAVQTPMASAVATDLAALPTCVPQAWAPAGADLEPPSGGRSRHGTRLHPHLLRVLLLLPGGLGVAGTTLNTVIPRRSSTLAGQGRLVQAPRLTLLVSLQWQSGRQHKPESW